MILDERETTMTQDLASELHHQLIEQKAEHFTIEREGARFALNETTDQGTRTTYIRVQLAMHNQPSVTMVTPDKRHVIYSVPANEETRWQKTAHDIITGMR